MMGKRMSHSSKGRLASKGQDGGKPSSPGPSAFSKPQKLLSSISQGKIKSECTPIPYIKMQDNAVALPRYSAVASRSTEEPIGMDELDSLQAELESLLCNSALRIRMFQSEIESIDTNESKREKRGKAAGKQIQYSGKRKYQEEKSIKPKENTKMSNQPKMTKFTKYASTTHGSFSHDNLLSSDNSVKLEMSQFALPKNNVPYKFWNSVEPYCAPITLDDVKFLESLLSTSSNATLPPIPPLGKHYSEVWADEHISEDQNASSVNKHKSSGVSPDASAIRKKTEKLTDNMITGPLTQRLVSALMEENAMPYDVPDIKPKHLNNIRSSYKNSLALEKCLRKELVEQGILDPEDLPPMTNPADDEILAEIKKCQAELTVVRKENCRNIRNLIALCKQEMVRVNLKKQLDQADAECVEMYKKILSAKQKKKPLTKKEKDDAWKAINDQIKLNKEINALPLTGPNSA